MNYDILLCAHPAAPERTCRQSALEELCWWKTVENIVCINILNPAVSPVDALSLFPVLIPEIYTELRPR